MTNVTLELTDDRVEETTHSNHQGDYTDYNGLLGSMCQGRSRERIKL